MFHTEGNIDIYTLFSGTSTSCSNIVSKVDDNTLLSHIFLSKTSENQIQLNSSISLSNARLTLYDMKGSAFAVSLQQDNTIDVSNLQAGLYVLRLQTADQKLVGFKFVKQ
jgi:Secretion system C-terminal sorting domain